MSDLLKITKTEGKVTILHLEGVLDGQTEKGFVDAAHAEFDAGKTALLLDFGKLDIITSAGLRALQNLYKKFTPEEEIQAWNAEHQGEVHKAKNLRVAQASSEVTYILSITGFLQSLYVYADIQEALDSF